MEYGKIPYKMDQVTSYYALTTLTLVHISSTSRRQRKSLKQAKNVCTPFLNLVESAKKVKLISIHFLESLLLNIAISVRSLFLGSSKLLES